MLAHELSTPWRPFATPCRSCDASTAMVRRSDSASQMIDRPPEPTASEATPLTSLRILVVDDNSDSAATLAELLELDGNQTYIASAHGADIPP
jgi:PleD family two-component response regulator